MNHYGTRAQRHWREHLPHRYAQIQDPAQFFTDLGAQAAAQVEALMLELAGDDPPGETFLEKTGRIGRARLQAEEIVRAELLMPDPATDIPPQAASQETETAG